MTKIFYKGRFPFVMLRKRESPLQMVYDYIFFLSPDYVILLKIFLMTPEYLLKN